MNKLKTWFKKTGLTNVGYLAGAGIAFVLGSKLAIGAMLGIFIYINFNVLQKLVKDKISDFKK